MLTFNLKKEWFEKIKSGEKTHEYREVKPYWIKRLSKLIDKYFPLPLEEACKDGLNHLYHLQFLNPFAKICFVCGYASKDNKEKILFAKVRSLYIYRTGKGTDLRIDNPVFDIEFELIGDKND